jgi:hypothetical protein
VGAKKARAPAGAREASNSFAELAEFDQDFGSCSGQKNVADLRAFLDFVGEIEADQFEPVGMPCVVLFRPAVDETAGNGVGGSAQFRGGPFAEEHVRDRFAESGDFRGGVFGGWFDDVGGFPPAGRRGGSIVFVFE